jgi:peptidoglycan/LPS O-acetylase OafA/YrhL
MARILRIANAFFCALFVAMTIVSAAFVSAGRDGFTGAPDGRASLAWAALFALLALLAFVNLRRASREPARGLLLLNLAAAIPLACGAIAAEGIRFLCGAAAFPFALTALLLALARNETLLKKTLTPRR